jgi:hypothetical protein
MPASSAVRIANIVTLERFQAQQIGPIGHFDAVDQSRSACRDPLHGRERRGAKGCRQRRLCNLATIGGNEIEQGSMHARVPAGHCRQQQAQSQVFADDYEVGR